VQILIGITAGEVLNNSEAWAPRVHGQAHTYIDAVSRSGATPTIIPLLNDETQLRHLYDMCAALLLSGGNDINPKLYGAEPSDQTVNISSRRDKQELQLLRWALEDNKPVLGICRGMQLINVSLGGTLYQDVDAEVPTADSHIASQIERSFGHIAHNLRVEETSMLASILDTHEIGVNALHHQAIKDLGKGLHASAWAEDGIIEALEMPDKRFLLGVQSHPEALEHEIEPRWRNLFASLTDAAISFN
jgi:putative glutamine amidotransferase